MKLECVKRHKCPVDVVKSDKTDNMKIQVFSNINSPQNKKVNK